MKFFNKLKFILIALIVISMLFFNPKASKTLFATTLNYQVGASTDDCRAYWDGSAWQFATNTNYLWVGYDASNAYKGGGGMRFTGVAIPAGSTINNAYITLTATPSESATTVNSKIHAEAADNPATFSNYSNYSGRTRTTAVVTWNSIAAWTNNTAYNSPDISSVVQEVVNRAGWASGNAMVIFWDDHDDLSTHSATVERDGYTYDNSTTYAPKLHIEYTANVPPTVTTTSPATNIKDTTATAGGNITNTGTATVTERGICYSSVNNPPTTADSKVSETGSFSTGAYTENLTGLSINTTYHFRAYAINTYGTSYGSTVDLVTYNSSASSTSAGLVVMGRMYPNESYTTGLTAFSTTNIGNCAIDITISGTDMTGGNTWTLSDTATPGANTFGLKAGLSGGDYTIVVKKTATYNTLVSNLAIGASQQFGLKFYTPSSMDDAAVKTGTVTLNISMH